MVVPVLIGDWILRNWVKGSSPGRKLSKGALAIIVTSFIARRIYQNVKRKRNKRKMEKKRQEVAARKKNLEERLYVNGSLMTPEREAIISKDIKVLLEELCSGQLDPLQVLEAYQAKALLADKDINAVCDFITEATSWAKSLKDIPEKERGALFGLPISVKECFYVKGYDCTIGLAQYIGKPAQEDCSFVRALKDLHAIPFCLTNIPQTMVSYSCSNPVYGNTANPHDHTRTPGGSSGGEAALIGAGGSILGIGSDVGGSLRIPAHFSGVCGLKPSLGRIYESGRRGAVGSGGLILRTGIYSVAGFMSSSVAGLEVGMRALLQDSSKMAAQDWRVAPLNWNEGQFNPGRKLKVGYYLDDGVFPPTPGLARAVKEVVDLLASAGHEVVPWTPPNLMDIYELGANFLLADKGHFFLKTMRDEVIDESMETLATIYKIPVRIKKVFAFLISFVSLKMNKLWSSGMVTTQEQWVANAKKDRLIYELTHSWETNGFDVVLSPAFAMPACPPSYCSKLLPATSYTAVYNLVGCPAGILPVTKESAGDQAALAQYPVNDDLCHRFVRNATLGAEGCPIGIQVVGRHFQEEMVLHAMAIIEDLVSAAN